MKDKKITIDKIIKDFKQYYPSLSKRKITDWHFSKHMTIVGRFVDTNDSIIYDGLSKRANIICHEMDYNYEDETFISESKTKSIFSERLKLIMETEGINQTELANKTGISRQSINKYIKGESLPDIFKINVIARALGYNPSYFLVF